MAPLPEMRIAGSASNEAGAVTGFLLALPPGRRVLVCLLLLAFVGPVGPAKADWPSASRLAGAAALGLLVPSEIGWRARRDEGDFVFGWSWQIPLTAFTLLAADQSNRGEGPSDSRLRHRLVGGLDLLPGASDGRVRGRVGYRFSLRYFLAGLGGSFASSGTGWSPELGVRFLHSSRGRSDGIWDPALHLLVRSEIAPAFDELRAVTVLFGWSFI